MIVQRTQTTSFRYGQLRATLTGEPVQERKHDWLEILGEGVEHSF